MLRDLLPQVRIEIDEPEGFAPEGPPFVDVRRRRVRVVFEDGSRSAPFSYDCVVRSRLDAVVIAPHFVEAGVRKLVFRTCLRPPVQLRPMEVRPIEEPPWLGQLLELPAGLVEADERSPEGLRACAARELLEETGYRIDAARVRPLGPSAFPAPGVIGERHFFFEAEIDPAAREEATSDGSAIERAGRTVILPLAEALEMARRGELEDEKTELALRRLAERVG